MRYITLPVLAALASACAINADMDDYSNGITDEFIVGSIPGYPSGDAVVEPTNDVFIIDGEAISGQVMQVNEIATFRAANHTRPDDYIVRWRGERLAGSSQPIVISVLDNQDRMAVGVRITQFDIEFITGEAPDAPVDVALEPGYHDIALTIGQGVAHNIALSVTDSNGETTTFGSIDPVDWEFDELHRVVVEAGDGARYQLDDLVAELRN